MVVLGSTRLDGRSGVVVACHSMASTCYMCDSVETSREHVPPACFFPPAKEIGRDLRRNLITVPSCDVHNSLKAKDDEYLLAIIAMTAALGNQVGQHQFFGRFLRAVARRPHVYRSFFRDRGTFANGTLHASKIDRPRFNRCIDQLARALYFHVYERKWPLPISIISPNIFSGIQSDQVVPYQPTEVAVEASRRFLDGAPNRGENPEVFKYRVRYDESDQGYAFAAIFYGYFEVFAYSSRELVESRKESGAVSKGAA